MRFFNFLKYYIKVYSIHRTCSVVIYFLFRSKFGMTLVALGTSAEYKDQNIGFIKF